MKYVTMGLFAIASIAVGVYFGLQGGLGQKDASQAYANLGGGFTLQSDQGEVSLSDFAGKVTPIYFGFTSCPDVCITALSKMSKAIQSLSEEEQKQLQPIFITVDPERDTAERVGEYARYYHSSIIGLTGSPEQIAQVAKQYLVIYEKVEMQDSKMGYTLDHSSIIYLVGKDGQLKKLVHHMDTAEMLVTALREVLEDS
jgi:protein SCO1/2